MRIAYTKAKSIAARIDKPVVLMVSRDTAMTAPLTAALCLAESLARDEMYRGGHRVYGSFFALTYEHERSV